ncbi:matrix metalloproteinase-19-like [Eucyclogobius newberryi]|uniref:matrix metalloproteinase-19-like n=1 Tax=Eucyclogobius newberryi TaxID=166745 RepID=UPI003B5B582E
MNMGRTRLELLGLVILLQPVLTFAVRREEAIAYLHRYGYLHSPLSTKRPNYRPEELADAIRTFQKVTKLPVTGRFDAATVRMMDKPRCGLEDAFNDRVLNYRILGKWKKKMLTYHIYNFASDLGQEQTRSSIQSAFRYWSEVSPLGFRELHSGKADIQISFHKKETSCPVPFDGRGHVLAHADAPESGLIHFDADELWTEGRSYGSNLRIVAAHEIGHALGLGHSQYYSAIMGPVYSGYRSNFKLHPDDIQGIQYLYGKPRSSNPVQAAPAGGRASDLCKVKLDAVMLGPKEQTYLFSGPFVWTRTDSVSRPVPVSALWKELPGSLSAAVHSPRTGKSYFIKGDRVWRYSGFKLDHGFPRRLSNIPADIDSAFYSNKNKKLVFLKRSGYWQWDEFKPGHFKSFPLPISQLFKGAPSDTDAAVTWTDDNVYLFKGSQFWRGDPDKQKVKSSPASTASRWLQCDD